MKIAVVTMDGEAVSQHFGRSPYYAIITVEDGKVSSRELRRRGTGHFSPGGPQHGGDLEESGRHGYGPDARMPHAAMAQEISDYKVLIAGGMGSGAHENFTEARLDVILTDIETISDAVTAYVSQSIKNLASQRGD